MADWFFVRAGQRQGPVSAGQLRQAIQTGAVGTGDLVWTEGMAQWLPAAAVPDVCPPGMLPAAGPVGYAAGSYPPPQPIGQDAGIRLLLPVGRSGWAIAAGYLGLFSFVLLPAPLSLIISIIAIHDIRTHPDRHGMGRAIFGLVMGILGTGLLVLMVVAVAMDKHHR